MAQGIAIAWAIILAGVFIIASIESLSYATPPRYTGVALLVAFYAVMTVVTLIGTYA